MNRVAYAFSALLAGCSAQLVEPNAESIDEYISSLPYLPTDDAQIQPGDRSAAMREGDYQCTTQNLRETRQFDRIVAYAANSDSLYPGALVSADSVMTGLFTQVVLPRAPGTISISLENLAGKKTATIAEPSLSTYRDALSKILDSEIIGSTPANLYSEIEEVHSEKQLDMALSIQASWGLGITSLKTSFDFSNKQVQSRHVVRYTQAYYTVDFDAPGQPSELLLPTVRLDDVKAKMDDRRPPAYVASVTYGRMVVFTIESDFSSEEMGAALEFAYSGGTDVSGDVSVTYKDMLSRSKITAFILGGDAGTAVESIDSYDALIEFIKEGGNYSRLSPGSPIAYKLNYLKDNSPARMSYTTDYEVKECTRVSQKVRVTLNSIAVDTAGGDPGSDLELFGKITAEGTNLATLFDKSSGDVVHIREGQQFGGTSGPVAEALIDVAPGAGNTIRLRGDLRDDDGLLGTDGIGNEEVSNPFETGWHKDVTVTLTGSDARVRLNFSLAPL